MPESPPLPGRIPTTMRAARPPGHFRRRNTRTEGNARLTAGLAAVLFVLLAAEGVTILRIYNLLNAHVVIGLMLVPPVMAKLGSTTWRFAHYYLGDPDYRRKGPPLPILRALGPLLVLLTVILFASGIGLLLGPVSWYSRLLFLHKASFVLWILAMAVHVLGHLVETGRLAPRDWMQVSARRVRGAGARRLLIVSTLVAGVILGASLVGHIDTFRAHFFRFHTPTGPGQTVTPGAVGSAPGSR